MVSTRSVMKTWELIHSEVSQRLMDPGAVILSVPRDGRSPHTRRPWEIHARLTQVQVTHRYNAALAPSRSGNASCGTAGPAESPVRPVLHRPHSWMVLQRGLSRQGEALGVEELIGSVEVWGRWLPLTHGRMHSFPWERWWGDTLPNLRLGQLVVDAEVAVPWGLRALPCDRREPRHHGGGCEMGWEGLVGHSFHCLNTVAGVRCDWSPHIAAQRGRRRWQVIHCRHTRDLSPWPRVHAGFPRGHLTAVGRAQHLLLVGWWGAEVVIVTHRWGGLQVGALAGQVQVPRTFCGRRKRAQGWDFRMEDCSATPSVLFFRPFQFGKTTCNINKASCCKYWSNPIILPSMLMTFIRVSEWLFSHQGLLHLHPDNRGPWHSCSTTTDKLKKPLKGSYHSLPSCQYQNHYTFPRYLCQKLQKYLKIKETFSSCPSFSSDSHAWAR